LFHHRHNTVGPSVITRGETKNSVLGCVDLADTLILSWAPFVNAYSRDDLTRLSVEQHWTLMFVGQRLMFLLEKDKVLCAF
jgi:hypothetical protein